VNFFGFHGAEVVVADPLSQWLRHFLCLVISGRVGPFFGEAVFSLNNGSNGTSLGLNRFLSRPFKKSCHACEGALRLCL